MAEATPTMLNQRTIAGYEVVGELHRGPMGSVLLARRVGRAGGERAEGLVGGGVVAVKVCEPPADVLGDEAARAVVAGFVESARVQSEAAKEGEEGARNWLRVHEWRVGDGEGDGAFMVADLAVRGPISKLVTGAQRIDEAGLHNIAASVVSGLRALKRRGGRAHGALHAGNILLMDELPPGKSRIVLCDPAPTAALGPDSLAEDLRALGRVLYALVMRRPHAGGWPLSASGVWTELDTGGSGRSAAWRDLVNRLLDPGLRDDEAGREVVGLPLEELARSIEQLAPGRAGGRKGRSRAVAAALAAAVLIGGGAYIMLQSGRGGAGSGVSASERRWTTEPEAQARWQDVCDDYYNWLWSLTRLDRRVEGDLGGALAGASRREVLESGAPELVAAIAAFGEGAEHPGVIAGVRGAEPDFRALRIAPTAAARSDEGVEKTERLAKEIEAFKRLIGREWSGTALLRNSADEFGSLGWSAAAARARALADRLNAAAEFGDKVGATIDEAAAAQLAMKRIVAARASLAEAGRTLAATGDAFVAGFASAVPGLAAAGLTGRGDALEDLAASVERVAALGTRLSDYARGGWRNVETEELFASAEHRALVAGSAHDAAAFESWIAMAERYPSLDPSSNPLPSVHAMMDGLNRAVESFEREVAPASPMDSELARVVSDLRSGFAEVAELGWVKRNRERIEGRCEALSRAIPATTARIEKEVVDHRRNAARSREEVVRQLQDRRSVSERSAAINAEWRSRRDRLLASGEGLTKDQIAASARRLEAALAAVDAAFPTPPARGDRPAAWRGAFVDAVVAEREARIGRALATLGEDGSLSEDAARSAAEREAVEFRAWLEPAAGLLASLDRIDRLLQDGHGLDDRPDLAGAEADRRPVQEHWATLSSQIAGTDPRLAAAAALLGQRIDRLRAISTEQQPDALIGVIESARADDPESAIAAWRRLSSPEIGWPRVEDDPARAGAVRRALSECISGSSMDPARRQTILADIESGFVARWRAMVNSALDPSSGGKAERERRLARALDAAEAFGVTDAALNEGDARVRYARALSRLKSLPVQSADQAAAAAAGAFASAVGGLPQEIASRPAVVALTSSAKELASSINAPGVEIAPSALGPGRRGLSGRLEQEGRAMVYSIGDVPVRFVRVEPAGAGAQPDAFYLAETEVSMEVLQRLISMARIGRGEFFDLVPEMDRDGGWAGPRVWDWPEGGEFGLSRYWVESQSVYQSTSGAYAPGLAGDARATSGRGLSDRAGGNPKRTHAAQRISARLAARAAAAAGCRLPTVAEWRAAADQAGNAPLSSENLRDQTFQTQYVYIDQVQRGPGANFLSFFPYPDQFSYAGARPGAGRSHEFNDNVLWFREVGDGPGTFKNLRGNVAELVYLTDGPIADQPPQDAPVGAIGGSALSDAASPIDQPRPIESTLTTYADVGFRLAFSAAGTRLKPRPLAERIAERVRDESLLLE